MINYMYFVYVYKIINNWKYQVVLKLVNNVIIYYSVNYTIIAQYTVQRIINVEQQVVLVVIILTN